MSHATMLQDLRERVVRWWHSVGGRLYAEPAQAKAAEDAAAEATRCQELGMRLLREAKPAEALACFTGLLATSPLLAEAHHSTGLALRALGRREEALASFQRAIELEHDHVPALTHQGLTCLELGRCEDAADCLNLALAFDPSCVSAHLGLATFHASEERPAAAIEHLERAAELDPQSPVPLVRLSAIRERLGQHDHALACLQKAAALAPGVAEVEYNLGKLCLKLDRPQDAAIHLERAITFRPNFAAAHLILGNALLACGNSAAAIESYRGAIALRPDYAEAYHDLGNAYRLRNEADKALAAYQTALGLKPDYAAAQLDIGVVLYDQGRVDDAIACYQKALLLRSDFPEAQVNLGLAWLALGDFERGWAGYEWRFRQTAADNRVVKRAFPCPEWHGEDLAGKSILIWGEQGISDQIQFAGMFGEISQVARTCTIQCAPKLMPLFARSFPKAKVIPLLDPAPADSLRDLDFHTAAGSVARWLRPTLESFPRRAGYLVADNARVELWRQRLRQLGPGLKVGFSWRSGNLKGVRALFSTRIEEWCELFQVAHLHWVCLQYDDCEAELELARRRFGVTLTRFADVDYRDDLDEVSALMGALDLVISAPTAVSIQAAALGVEVWQVNYGVDWQAHGTPDNPWFPTLARHERRPDQTWGEILAGIARRFETRARKAGPVRC
jgi:tetratricopeptide (TPR) repeat protein